MMKLNEHEMEKVEALAHFVKYANLDPEIHDYQLYDAVMRLTKLGEKITEHPEIESQISEHLKLDDMKEVVEKFLLMLCNRVEEGIMQDSSEEFEASSE